MTKTGIVEPEMSLRIRRSFSLGSRLRRIRLAPMRRRGRLPSLWTAALSESGYIFAKASADARTQIGACRRGIHKILGMLSQGCVHELVSQPISVQSLRWYLPQGGDFVEIVARGDSGAGEPGKMLQQ